MQGGQSSPAGRAGGDKKAGNHGQILPLELEACKSIDRGLENYWLRVGKVLIEGWKSIDWGVNNNQCIACIQGSELQNAGHLTDKPVLKSDQRRNRLASFIGIKVNFSFCSVFKIWGVITLPSAQCSSDAICICKDIIQHTAQICGIIPNKTLF